MHHPIILIVIPHNTFTSKNITNEDTKTVIEESYEAYVPRGLPTQKQRYVHPSELNSKKGQERKKANYFQREMYT